MGKKLFDYFRDENGDHVYVYKDKEGNTYAELEYDDIYADEEQNPTGEYYTPEMNELDD